MRIATLPIINFYLLRFTFFDSFNLLINYERQYSLKCLKWQNSNALIFESVPVINVAKNDS